MDRRAVSESGEESTEIFRKTREMTSLRPSHAENQACHEPELIATVFGTPRRQGLALYRESQASSPVFRFSADLFCIFAENFGMYPTFSARKTDFFSILRENLV